MFKYFLNAALIFMYGISAFSQTCQPNDPYDQIVSDFHSTIARRQDGTLVIWGEDKASNGLDNVLTPIEINSINYPGLTGIPLKGALGSKFLNASQAIVLTTTGLFVWGKEGIVISNTLTTSPAFQKITVAGKEDGLPPGVFPKNIKVMTATCNALAIVTDSGYVWVLGNSIRLYGDGSATTTSDWHQVRTSIAPYPLLKNIVHLRVSINAAFAVDSNNVWYTWGARVFNGLNNPTFSTRATTIIKPTSITNELPKMIGVTSINTTETPDGQVTATAYFVLTQSGDLYAEGDGYSGVLGNGSTNNKLTWGKVKKNSTEDLANVIFISVQEHDATLLSACAITADNNLWYWGQNDYSDPFRTTFSTYPVIPPGFSANVDKANYTENGGHTLVYVKDAATHYCYIGHRINGSMGDGTATDAYELTMNCTNTAAIPLCSLCPATYNNTIPKSQAVCESYPVKGFDANAASLSNNNSVFYQWQVSVISKDTAFADIKGATEKNYSPQPLTKNTWYRRIVKNNTPNCPVDSSNVLQVVVNPLPLKPLISSYKDVCAGDSIVLNGSATDNITYAWTGPDEFKSTLAKPVIYNSTNENSGEYTLNVIDKNKCSSGTTIAAVTVHTIDLTIATPPTICEGLSVLLEVKNPQTSWSYLWTGPDGFISNKNSPFITQVDSDKLGTYTIHVTDERKCTATETITITFAACEDKFTVPEGFSPNGDGINDFLIIRGLSNYPNHSIVIFNRWGEKVYQAAPYNNDWKGLSQFGIVVGVGAGDVLPEGTYFYLLDKNNGEDPIKGSIYLKR